MKATGKTPYQAKWVVTLSERKSNDKYYSKDTNFIFSACEDATSFIENAVIHAENDVKADLRLETAAYQSGGDHNGDDVQTVAAEL